MQGWLRSLVITTICAVFLTSMAGSMVVAITAIAPWIVAVALAAVFLRIVWHYTNRY